MASNWSPTLEQRKKYRATYKARHPERLQEYERTRNLRQRFGMTLDQYDALLASQDGVCAICGGEQTNRRKKHLDVDHDHKTGRIRGLLCHRCNTGIGLFLDDIELLRKAVNYLG